jgi:protein phosphatase
VLQRGLGRDPAARFSRIEELQEAFEEAVRRARVRQGATQAVLSDCGSATTIGRSHEVMGLPNQDSHTLMSLGPNRHLAIVADGVTNAVVGSGEVASQVAVEVLSTNLSTAIRKIRPGQAVDNILAQGCLQASQAIIDLASGMLPEEGCDPADLMSSTVVVGLLSGNVLTLATAGDSRAYLIANGQAEQLTVDGDVRCMYLASGIAPEDVRNLGPDASALYSCLGVCEPVGVDRLQVCIERSQPAISRWTLLPGDVVVLCTDGLVEEGVFLEPGELPALVARPPGQSAAGMARTLLQAAKARQREPSPWEPLGCGDDITCIVLAIGPPDPQLPR